MTELCVPSAAAGALEAAPRSLSSQAEALGTIGGCAAMAAPWRGRRRTLHLKLPQALAAGGAAAALGAGEPAPPGLLRVLAVAAPAADGATLVVHEWPGRVTTAADLLAASAPGRCATPELLATLLLVELLAAVRHAHERGRAHGLLTPGCCFLTAAPPARLLRDCPRTPRLRLAGAGLAALLPAAALQRAVADPATARWLAPEVRDGGVPAAEADLWSAAAIARELLAAAGAAPGDRLARLLDTLQAMAGQRPPPAAAAERCRELALRGLAAWDARRDAARGAAVEPPGTTAGGRSGEAPAGAAWEATSPASPRRGRAGALRGAHASPAGGPAGLLAGSHRMVAAWATLGPAALAAALCLLLLATLLSGSCG